MPRLVGIGVNTRMIEYAREQAKIAQVDDRVDFQVMDALLILEFPKNYFDLTNMRFATAFMRTWNWPKVLDEMQRVTRPGGVIRLTENECFHSSSPPLVRTLAIPAAHLCLSGH